MASTPRERLEQRLAALKTERSGWLSTWEEISQFMLPRRGRFSKSGDARSRGQRIGHRIRNSTATYAIRTSVSGMNSGLTNPATKWFKLQPSDRSIREAPGVRAWLDAVEERIYDVLAPGAADAYRSFNSVYEELLAFGTAVMWHDEDRETVSQFTTFTAGDYVLGVNAKGEVDTCYREVDMTVAEIVERFGTDRISQGIKTAWDNGNYETKYPICHGVEPASRRVEGLREARRWPYVSVYWEPGAPTKGERGGLLAVKGYRERPFTGVRWDTIKGDVYGRSPGMDVLPDVKQLQDTEASKWRATQELAGRGPLQGPILQGGPLDLALGAYNPTMQGEQLRVRPIIEMQPAAVQYIGQDISILEERIKTGLYADLFLIFAMDRRNQRATAREIEAVDAEKLMMLGPMVLNANTELLKPTIDRVYSILERAAQPLWERGLPAPLPEPPEALSGQELEISYQGVLQTALQRVTAGSINNFMMSAVPLVQLKPDALDKIDMDQVLDELGEATGIPGTILRSDDVVAQERANRAQQQAAMQQMAMLGEAAKAAQPAANAMATMQQVEQGGNVPAP